MTDEEILKEAKERLSACISSASPERQKQLMELKFSTIPEAQWPDDIRSMRENDLENGPRPCLTIDKINQYITQVVNDERQNRPGVKVRPVDDAGDVETAKVFNGIIKHIEDRSNANIAYETAGESAVRIGEGYFRFLTEYESDVSTDQVIKVVRIPSMFNVYLGTHVMPTGADAEYGFIINEIPLDRYKREFPKANHSTADFGDCGEMAQGKYWAENDSVFVVEYFYFDYVTTTILRLSDGRDMTKKQYDEFLAQETANVDPLVPPQPLPTIVKTRESQVKTVKWCKFSGLEILEKQDWAGKWIPIVKVIGKEAWVDGKRLCWGLVRFAQDSLRAYNYWFSTLTEIMALSPKSPFIGAVGQFATQELQWRKANNTNFSHLEYDPIDVNGQLVPPPQRQSAIQVQSAIVQILQIIEHDIQTALGMFKASTGENSPQQSGKAILALTRQSDTGTFHFPDNMAESIKHGGRIMVDLVPKIYDTKRLVRLVEEDGEPKEARLDPKQPEAHREITTQQGIKSVFNLGVGTYDVTVTSGPSYTTRRMESADIMLEMTKGNPALWGTHGDIIAKAQDWPLADKFAERFKKMLPPQLQEGQQIPPQVQQKLDQMMQAVQALNQENQQLKAGQAEGMAKVQADAATKQAQIDAQRASDAEELRLKKEKQDAEIKLAREKAEAEIALKVWFAKQEIEIDRMKAKKDTQETPAVN